MTASMWPTVLDAVVDVLAAADLGGAVIFDGPPPIDDATRLGVAVGMPMPDGSEDTSGKTRQDWRDAGPAPFAHRQESGTIRCTAWAWTGNDWTFRALRDAVRVLLDDVHAALAAITPLGLPQVTNLQVLDEIDWVQRQDARGTTCEAMFTVTYEAVFT